MGTEVVPNVVGFGTNTHYENYVLSEPAGTRPEPVGTRSGTRVNARKPYTEPLVL